MFRQRGDVCFMRHFMEAHNIFHPFKVKVEYLKGKNKPIKYKMISNSQHFLSSFSFVYELHQFLFRFFVIENAADCWTLILDFWLDGSWETFNEWIQCRPTSGSNLARIFKKFSNWDLNVYCIVSMNALLTCCIIALTLFSSRAFQ